MLIELNDDLAAVLETYAQALGVPAASLAERLLRTQLIGSSRGQSPDFQRNHAAFQQKLAELLETHADQFVAFFNGELVGIGADQMELKREMYAKFGYVNMLITKVTTQLRVVHIPHHYRVR